MDQSTAARPASMTGAATVLGYGLALIALTLLVYLLPYAIFTTF